MLWIKKYWYLLLALLLLLSGLLFNDSFRTTISRRHKIRKAQTELASLEKKAKNLQAQLDALENHPEAYEQLVRKELGYVRPGEKEVRFLKKKNK